MFGLARRNTFALSRRCCRSISASAVRWQDRNANDIFVEHGEDEDGPRQSWADRMRPEPLEAGTPSENPHLNQLFNLAKDVKTQKIDQDLKEIAAKRVSEAWNKTVSLRIYELPEMMTEENLHDLFSPYGEISDIRIGVIGKIRMGSVAFKTTGSADKAVQAHEYSPMRFNGEELRVRYGSMTRLNPPSKTLFVTNFHPDAVEAIEARLTYNFNPWGRAQRLRYIPKTNMCFLDFNSVEEAQAVVDRHELRPFRDQGRILRINFAVEKQPLPPHHTLCITGYYGDAYSLESYFPQHDAGNHIVEITSVPDATGDRPPAYFVRFESTEYATQALQEAQENTQLPFKARYASVRKGRMTKEERERRRKGSA